MVLTLGIAGLLFLEPPWNLLAVVLAALVEIGEVFLWIRFLRRYRVTTGVEGMVGERAIVTEVLDPLGRVALRGEIWRAMLDAAERPLAPGEEVAIVDVEGLTLRVRRPAQGGAREN